jgi:hypothetical protein
LMMESMSQNLTLQDEEPEAKLKLILTVMTCLIYLTYMVNMCGNV